ncbi:MAG: hypothetical protein SFV19_09740 [Rhodospirillaceae bacterium]|nr:hypothetical protein [Rhodospirillaceae bacterium]
MPRKASINAAKRPRRRRAKPGASGKGAFFHVEVRPKGRFVAFRAQDVGGAGGIERVAGRRASGTWDTQKWLIGKAHAHVAGGRLIADTAEARHVLAGLSSRPVHLGGDRFKAKPRRDIPESAKPTPAQRRAQRRNIKKAQAARRKR